jgi:hypothetical protein
LNDDDRISSVEKIQKIEGALKEGDLKIEGEAEKGADEGERETGADEGEVTPPENE